MGRVFLEQMSGHTLYNCLNCGTNLTSHDNVLAWNFVGEFGRAYLCDNVVNVLYGQLEFKRFLTGRHYVKDVMCKKCFTVVGWYYAFSPTDEDKTKEEKFCLEESRITPVSGIVGEFYGPPLH